MPKTKITLSSINTATDDVLIRVAWAHCAALEGARRMYPKGMVTPGGPERDFRARRDRASAYHFLFESLRASVALGLTAEIEG